MCFMKKGIRKKQPHQSLFLHQGNNWKGTQKNNARLEKTGNLLSIQAIFP